MNQYKHEIFLINEMTFYFLQLQIFWEEVIKNDQYVELEQIEGVNLDESFKGQDM